MVKRRLAERRHIGVSQPNYVDDPAGALLPAVKNISGTFMTLAKKRDEMKMNNMLADAELEMSQYTAEWQKENISNPFDPEAGSKLKQKYEEIFNKYGEQVSFQSRGKWNGVKNSVVNDFMKSNLRWGTAQSIKNAEFEMNAGIEKTTKLAYNYGANGSDIALAMGAYEKQAALMRESMDGLKSEAAIDYDIENYKSDYLKSFVSGKIYADPEMGMELLTGKTTQMEGESDEAYKKRSANAKKKYEQVQAGIGSEEAMGVLRDSAEKRIDELNEYQAFDMDDTQSGLVAQLADNDQFNFAQNMEAIELAYKSGGLGVGTKADTMRKKLIDNAKSKHTLTAQVNEDLMADLLLSIDDAQAEYKDSNKKKKSSIEYLNKLAEIRMRATNANTKGIFYSGDLTAVNKAMVDKVSEKTLMAQATDQMAREGGWTDFSYSNAYNSKKYFGALPETARKTALRDFFYQLYAEEHKNGGKFKKAGRKTRTDLAAKITLEYQKELLEQGGIGETEESNVPSYGSLEEAAKAREEGKLNAGDTFTVGGTTYEV